MHSIETKTEFFRLRADGATLAEISKRLQVPISTLGVWNREARPEINRLRALEWEHYELQIGHTLEESLRRLADRIRRFEEALDKFPVKSLHPKDWLRIIQHSRRDYLKLRSILMAPLDEPPKRLLPRPESTLSELYKIVRTNGSSESQPRNTNHLQQPAPASSNSVTPERAEPRCKTESDSRGLASREPSSNPDPQPANAVQDSQTPSHPLAFTLSPSPALPSASPRLSGENGPTESPPRCASA